MRKTEPILALVIILGVVGTIILIEMPTPRDKIVKILSVYGTDVETPDHEEGYRLLVEHGQFYDNPVRFIEGPDHKCFESSEKYFLANPGSVLCTGWAFSRNRWWWHYWILDTDGFICEFTIKREVYFGMVFGVWE